MKDWQIILAVLVGVLFLRFLFRERFQDSPTGVRGPPYNDTDVIKILDLDLSKTDDEAASSDFVKEYRRFINNAINDLINSGNKGGQTIEPVDIRTELGRRKIFELIEPYILNFYNDVYSPATTPITEEQVNNFVDTNLPKSSFIPWLNVNQVENIKKLMKKYFVDQPPGPPNVGTTSNTQQTTTSSTEATQQTASNTSNDVNVKEILDNPVANPAYSANISKVESLKGELLDIEKRIANNNLANVNYLELDGPLGNRRAIYDSWDTVLKHRIVIAAVFANKLFPEQPPLSETEFTTKFNLFKNDPVVVTFPPDWFVVMEKITRKMAGLPERTSQTSTTTQQQSTTTPGQATGNMNTTTGGSTTSSWGPSGSETAGGKGFNVFGPLFAGVGEGGGNGAVRDSTKTNTYPELIGGRLGSGKTRVDGVGMINPSVNAPGMNANLPDFNTLGRSLMPGDQDPYRVSQTFSPSSYSSRGADPVPFLTDFSAFLK